MQCKLWEKNSPVLGFLVCFAHFFVVQYFYFEVCMIFKKQKFVFQMRKSIMVAEKYKRNYCWHFWISINRKPIYIIKALNFINSFWPYGRLLENPKTLGLGELFLPKNDLKTCSAVNFTKWLKKWILWVFFLLIWSTYPAKIFGRAKLFLEWF